MNEILRADNVSKKFSMGGKTVDALSRVNLSVFSGQYVSIVGPSGAGKSTLLYLLGLIDSASEGQILFKGKVISDLSPRRKARFRGDHIGFVFQSFYLLPELNCLQNVAIPSFIQDPKKFWKRKEIYKKARIMLHKVGLGDRLIHKPAEMSGGEMQRVAICRSLMNGPSIILADEPTGNLDSKNSEVVADLLFSLCREEGKALVLATHNENLARRADKIVKLIDGKIVGS
ncbi:MAG: ABC transporter ATP-binding protein [Candidatus Aureabacteria bacterium]|nr:ABC transporter ATP-binding protein [Candidatus Auribacterota bacterium]